MVQIIENSGDSEANAIVILASNHSDGIKAEYDYIEKHHGQPHVDWELLGQQLLDGENKQYDKINIRLKDGTTKAYYFDITDFMGKFDEEIMNLIEQGSQPQGLFARFARFISRIFSNN